MTLEQIIADKHARLIVKQYPTLSESVVSLFIFRAIKDTQEAKRKLAIRSPHTNESPAQEG